MIAAVTLPEEPPKSIPYRKPKELPLAKAVRTAGDTVVPFLGRQSGVKTRLDFATEAEFNFHLQRIAWYDMQVMPEEGLHVVKPAIVHSGADSGVKDDSYQLARWLEAAGAKGYTTKIKTRSPLDSELDFVTIGGKSYLAPQRMRSAQFRMSNGSTGYKLVPDECKLVGPTKMVEHIIRWYPNNISAKVGHRPYKGKLWKERNISVWKSVFRKVGLDGFRSKYDCSVVWLGDRIRTEEGRNFIKNRYLSRKGKSEKSRKALNKSVSPITEGMVLRRPGCRTNERPMGDMMWFLRNPDGMSGFLRDTEPWPHGIVEDGEGTATESSELNHVHNRKSFEVMNILETCFYHFTFFPGVHPAHEELFLSLFWMVGERGYPSHVAAKTDATTDRSSLDVRDVLEVLVTGNAEVYPRPEEAFGSGELINLEAANDCPFDTVDEAVRERMRIVRERVSQRAENGHGTGMLVLPEHAVPMERPIYLGPVRHEVKQEAVGETYEGVFHVQKDGDVLGGDIISRGWIMHNADLNNPDTLRVLKRLIKWHNTEGDLMQAAYVAGRAQQGWPEEDEDKVPEFNIEGLVQDSEDLAYDRLNFWKSPVAQILTWDSRVERLRGEPAYGYEKLLRTMETIQRRAVSTVKLMKKERVRYTLYLHTKTQARVKYLWDYKQRAEAHRMNNMIDRLTARRSEWSGNPAVVRWWRKSVSWLKAGFRNAFAIPENLSQQESVKPERLTNDRIEPAVNEQVFNEPVFDMKTAMREFGIERIRKPSRVCMPGDLGLDSELSEDRDTNPWDARRISERIQQKDSNRRIISHIHNEVEVLEAIPRTGDPDTPMSEIVRNFHRKFPGFNTSRAEKTSVPISTIALHVQETASVGSEKSPTNEGVVKEDIIVIPKKYHIL